MKKPLTTATALIFYALFGMGTICGEGITIDWSVTGSDETDLFTLDTDGETRSWRITAEANAWAFPSGPDQSRLDVEIGPDDYQNIPTGDARADFELTGEAAGVEDTATCHLQYDGDDYSELAGCALEGIFAGCDHTEDCSGEWVLYVTYTGTLAMEDLSVRATASIYKEETEEEVPDDAAITVTIEELP